MGLLKNLFGKKKSGSQSEGSDQQEGTINIGKSVFPLIRPLQHRELASAKESNRPMVTKELFEDMVITFQMETPHGWLPLDMQTMETTQMPLDDIMGCAMRNLMGRTNSKPDVNTVDLSSKFPAAQPFYQITFSKDIDSSMLFNNDLFVEIAKQLETKTLAMCVPACDTVYVADMILMESFRTMKAYSTVLYDQSKAENKECSPSTYILKGGTWVTFLDTDEQFEELTS